MINEKIICFTGTGSQSFSPELTGITYTNPNYSKFRESGSAFVFEYIIEGEGTLYHDDVLYRPKKGDAYILHAQSKHYYFSDKENPWTKIWINVKGNLVKHLLEDYNLADTVLFPQFNTPEPLKQIITLAEKNPNADNPKIPVLIHQYIQELSSFLYRNEIQKKNAVAVKIKDYIDNSLESRITLEEISKNFYLSKAQIINIFKQEYGTTPYSYIINEKISIAKKMLANTTVPVSELSYKLGFNDAHYFSNFFKEFTGVSPLQYRKKHGTLNINSL